MISHINLPNITTDNLPSSLSHQLITDKLRTELGYNGIVITDTLSMKAIKQNYTCSDAAVKSILAGIDIILMPENYQEAFNSILSAVNSGIISESRINESVLQILALKEKYHLI